jgi:hypothetical protein
MIIEEVREMSEVNVGKINDVINEFLEEVYDGPKHEYTWFINNSPDSGLLGTIENMDSDEASTQITKNGTTIAAHIEHLRWTLEKTNSYLRGEKPAMIWSESWLVRKVNETEWETLIQQLRREYIVLEESVKKVKWASDEQLKEVLALIPHAAYHLGAIRQIALLTKHPHKNVK